MSGIDLSSILNKKEFNNLSNQTKQDILEVSQKIKTKSPTDAMQIIADFYKNSLSKEELTPSKKESIYKAITSSLDSKSKTQFDKLYDLLLSSR